MVEPAEDNRRPSVADIQQEDRPTAAYTPAAEGMTVEDVAVGGIAVEESRAAAPGYRRVDIRRAA